ncbi:MAG: protein kinase [Gemmatimonadaceae bacterium]
MIGRFGSFEFPLADRYRFEAELGRGAMGVVYRAHDLTLDRPVAIKMLHPSLTNEVGVSRFQSEIRIAAHLRHRNLIAVHESGEADGRLYYVMDYIGGETLRAHLQREKQLSNDEALRIVADVADALHVAHAQGIVHRDVKPENILLAEGRACLLDFGLARIICDVDVQRLTASGLSVGTPHYLSPEQASAERTIGPKADQYALACVLYEMLVGEPPFTGPTASSIAIRHIAEPPPPMRPRRPSVTRNIEAAVRKAMQKVPADRFADVMAFVVAAKATTPVLLSSEEEGQGPPGVVPQRRWWSRHPRIVAAAGVALALSITAAALIPRWMRVSSQDPKSIVIFPLHTGASLSGGAPNDIGESASLLIGYRLEGTPGIQFSNAADHLDGAERTGQTDLTLERKRRIANSLGADRLIDGWVQQHGESLTVVLRLQTTDGRTDPIQKGYTALASPADAPALALVALRTLLPAFLSPGRQVDQSALEQRNPAAIAAFLEGEREYRDSRFVEAVAHYAKAIERDSLLAVAALKASQASSWLNDMSDANEFFAVAIQHVDLLPPRYATYAGALEHYLRGRGDSAVASARTLVTDDPRWTDAWFLLGEASFHLMPTLAGAESQMALADSAFRAVRRLDPAFSPATHHLLDLAMQRADRARVDSFYPLVRPTLSPAEARWLDALVRCLRTGPASVDWRSLPSAGSRGAADWAVNLVFNPAGAACARAGFAAVIAMPSATPAELWGAVVATNASFIAAGRDEDAGRLLKTPVASKVRAWALLFPDVAGGARLVAEAKQKVDSLGTTFETLGSLQLWLLTSWYSRAGDSTTLARIAAVAAARRDSSHTHRDSLVASVASAHFAAARRDTAGALKILESLSPVAPYSDLLWNPWEAYAGERMLEAALLAGQGKYAEAIRSAARLDVPKPMINLVYLRQSLQLRERSARQLGDSVAAAGYRRQLARWSAADQ